MILRLIAPFRCHFNLNTHTILSDRESYCQFWDRADGHFQSNSHFDSVGELDFFHRSLRDGGGMAYQTIHEDWDVTKPGVIRITPHSNINTLIEQAVAEATQLRGQEFAASVSPLPETALFRIYDNTIGIFEISLKISKETVFQEDSGAFWDALQIWLNPFATRVTQGYYQDKIYPFLVKLWKLDRKGKFIQPPGHYAAFPDLTLDKASRRRRKKSPESQTMSAATPISPSIPKQLL